MSRACVLPTCPPSKLSLFSPGIPCQRLCCQAAQAGVQQTAHQGADDSQLAKHKQYPRFYCPQLPPAAGMSVELEPEEAKHAVRVLRLQAGGACLDPQGMIGSTYWLHRTKMSSATFQAVVYGRLMVADVHSVPNSLSAPRAVPGACR